MKCFLTAILVLLTSAYHSPLLAVDVDSQANVPLELKFAAQKTSANPFNDISLDVVFTEPDGTTRRVPAFWAGGQEWRVRYASSQVGKHVWRSECSKHDDAGLHNVSGSVSISPYRGDNPLFVHGPIRVAKDGRHFEHADGTPFFWLADTWWMGLSHRLHWPEDFQKLTADRKEKGFNVVQIVAGLYPDMPPFDPRGANEAGFPWEKEYTQIRPEYFDAADRRLRHLVDQGITPCIVGGWGYFLPLLGEAKAKAHWRYLIARYGSWPVVWCAAGEANLPYYLAKGFPYDDREQVHGWTEVLRSIRATDPWRRPLTIHPTAIKQYTARHATDDAALLDFDMLQTPHGQRDAVPVAVRAIRESYAAKPKMPVLDGEASYEMLSDSLPTEWTRAMFWLCMTNGACGHTYGANGIWQVNRKGDPHGASPHGGNYGNIAWDEALKLPGSSQVALGKKFFESLPWTELIPLPDGASWAEESSDVALGDWIWFPEGEPSRDAPVATRFFRRAFDLPEKAEVRSAKLRITADDKFTVWLNGQLLGSEANWREISTFDLTKALKPGGNVIAVQAENVAAPVKENPAGLIVGMQWELADGSHSGLHSDKDWRASKTDALNWRETSFDDSSWSQAKVAAKFGDAPWRRIGATESRDPPQACGIGDTLRVVYLLDARPVVVHALRPKASYQATVFDPVTGERTKPVDITSDAAGDLRIAAPTFVHDTVLLLQSPKTVR